MTALGISSRASAEGAMARSADSLRHPLLSTVLATLVWVLMLQFAKLGDLESWGLLSAVSPVIILAPLVAIAAFAVSLQRFHSDGVLTAHVAGIVLMLYGAGAMVGNSVQARIVLRHEGITDQVLRAGSIDPTIDAYFNWPGFFTFFAYVREVTGIESFAGVGIWIPAVLNFLYLAPLLMIFRYATDDRRIVWTSVLLFYLGNWIGQDYFAPQAAAFCVHLTILAILLRYFGGVTSTPTVQRWTRASHIVVVMVLFVAIVPSHQLTPPVTIVSVAGLVIANRCTARRLPHFMVGVFVTWLVFMSSTYLAGNLAKMLELVGDIGAAAGANVTDRVGGSAAHRTVVILRLGFTGLFGALAVVGWIRKLGSRADSDRAMVVLAITPVVLIAVQPYGGEMVLRVFMFTLPFVAFFAAHTVTWIRPARGWVRVQWVLVVPVLVLITLLFFVARYGNAALDQFTTEERTAIDAVYEDAPPGSLLLVAVDNVAWKYRGYDTYNHRSLDRVVRNTVDSGVYADAAVALMYQNRELGAYFIATESQQSYIDLLGGMPVVTLDVIEQQMVADPNIETMFDEPSVRVYHLPPAGSDS